MENNITQNVNAQNAEIPTMKIPNPMERKQIEISPKAGTIYHGGRGTFQTLPFHLQTQTKGKLRIKKVKHKAGTRLPVVSFRNAIYMGMRPTNILLERDVYIHELHDKDHGKWMSSSFQEMEQHYRQLEDFSGNVLVGGLGLGAAAAILALNQKVDHIIVVEKNKSIIDMVMPHLTAEFDDKIVCVHACLFAYLTRQQKRRAIGPTHWDYAFYDIWCPTGERIVNLYTLPLRKLSFGIIKQKNIQMWNEDEAIGQIAMALQLQTMLGPIIPTDNRSREEYIKGLEHAEFMEWAQTQSTGVFWNAVRQGMEPNETNQAHYLMSLQDIAKWKDRWEEYEIPGTKTALENPNHS